MGQLANEIQTAMDDKRPAVTPAIMKEAEEKLDAAALLSRFSEKAVKDKIDAAGKGIGGMDVGDASLWKALQWGGGLAIPASAIVAALMLRGHSKSEKRRKKLSEDYEATEQLSGRSAVAPTSFDVPVKAAMEKDAGLGWPLAIAAALLGPAAFDLIKRKTEGIGAGEWTRNLFQTVGDDPLTHWAGPSAIIGAPVLASALTHKLLGGHLDNVREDRMKREREKAETEFEDSLNAEYQSSKAAGLAERIDELATRYVALTKKAKTTRDPAQIHATRTGGWSTGLGSTGIGMLLLASLMLTGAAGVGGYQWAKSSDKGKKRSEALERLARRRALSGPPIMSATTQRPGEEDTIAEEPI